ncbi:DUF2975 domain-containing protein [Paenibacillus sp. FSL W7-1287]|uniref:DUF2975 domain-containing protein n=1 Tax=Paenibacillus sp. FSL W7-1287 TaxID=2954538 RepID=UPI0030F567FB
MKRVSTAFLKAAVIVIGIPVLAACIFVVPAFGNFAAHFFPEFSAMKIVVMLYMYVTVLPFYFALYKAYQLLNYIDQGRAFSELSVQALQVIKRCAVIISALYVLFLPMVYLLAEYDDAPGLILIGLFIVFAALVIAVFAAVLQKLLQEAIDIKSENDLTV